MNPYWTAVEPSVKPSDLSWGSELEVGRFKYDWRPGDPPILDRPELVHMYSWSITDPESVKFVARHQRNGLVDPMAGTGYWAYVLASANVDVVCYDHSLPETNDWHKDKDPWVDIEQLDATLAVVKHPDRTLLLSWPPYQSPIGVETINAYKGDRIIYIGEGGGGCTGSDEMYQVLDEEWEAVAGHTPIHWYGIRDSITVYQRRPRAALSQVVSFVRDKATLRTNPKRAAKLPPDNPTKGNLVPELQGGFP